MNGILEDLENKYLFFDGGYGTMFQSLGLKPGELPETWNIKESRKVTDVHKAYIKAGANIIKTNTFGANSLKFGDEGEFCLADIVTAAVNNAKKAVAEAENDSPAGNKYIALDIGPLGKLLKPFGDMDFEEAVDIFKKTVEIGMKAGADCVLIETMNDIYEAKAAILAARETTDAPVFLTAAFDENHKLLTGSDPKTVVAVAEGLGVSGVGVNCSLGPVELLPVVEEICKYASVPVICNPNAGLPKTVDGKTVYDIEPELFAETMEKMAGFGVKLFGGCCGTNPQYIEAVRNRINKLSYRPCTKKDYTVSSSYTHSVVFDDKCVLIGERINPTGKKKFKEALRNNDMDYILSEAVKQQDNGAHILDVNVGLPEINEVEMMVNTIKELQAVTDLPLQVDTTNATAMEKALRIYNGKALINSVNGKAAVMREIFPLVKKYGGVLIALTIDENGIPETAEGRVKIALGIIKEAEKYGIASKDIIVDPLCMSVSSDKNSAAVTLECIEKLKALGIKSSLGVSNISFGLPGREYINSSFFTLALKNGLNAAIMNPGSVEMMKAYKTYNALMAKDVNFEEYIEYASGIVNTVESVKSVKQASAKTEAVSDDELIKAIVKGLKDKAGSLTEEYLNSMEPLNIIDEKIIPALDYVGRGFENKTMFLPQLLMSAEASAVSFEKIKNYMDKSGNKGESKGRIIIATVKGDIHDIGKNIVKTLLENYGYDVIDLGKDVEPALILETAKRENIKLVGLSALMTTTVPAMEETIKLLRSELKDVRICVGGAVLTKEYADMIGADKYAKDAMETVRYAEEVYS